MSQLPTVRQRCIDKIETFGKYDHPCYTKVMISESDHDLTTSSLAWPKLITGTLIKRYKRFLADVKLGNNRIVTAHCPNSGSMKACCENGRTVYLSRHNNPKRKLNYTWELIRMPDSLVGVNTLVPNRLVAASIRAGRIDELTGYDSLATEVRTSQGTRLDLLLGDKNGGRCYVEIKNATLVENHIAYFPDAVTTRGLKHLIELQALSEKGFRSVIFYLVQRMDARLFKPAAHIDPAYAKELKKAEQNGVEVLVYDAVINLEKISLGRKLPYRL